MLPIAPGAPAPLADDELHLSLQLVERQLQALGEAVRGDDTDGIDRSAAGLHRALASAVDRFSTAARQGRVPDDLRQRLAVASGRVAAQRESLSRATAALDRAIDVLIPRDAAHTAYGPVGRQARPGLGHIVA